MTGRANNNDLPLAGKHIVITRPEQQSAEMIQMIKARGAVPYCLPVIEVLPVADLTPLDKRLKQLQQYDVLLFTSVNGVHIFFERLHTLRRSPRQNVLWAAVGEKTAQAIESYGYSVPEWPATYRQEELAEWLHGHLRPGQSILYPRAKKVRDHLIDELHRFRALVDDVIVYETVALPPQEPSLWQRRNEEQWDIVTFTSSSAVDSFVQWLKHSVPEHTQEQFKRMLTIGCIGSVTAATAREHGLKVDVIAKVFTVQGLLDALEDHFYYRKAGHECLTDIADCGQQKD